MIETHALSKRYGDTLVVDGVTLQIPRGGFTSIIGPNGAGKSTLLSMISRLLPMSSGSVLVDGMDVTRTPGDVLAKRLSILRQDNQSALRLTVRELVAFGRFPHSGGREMMQLLRRAADDKGKTVVVVLHDINFASCYSDHIVALRDGQLACQGRPDELIRDDVLSELYQMSIRVHELGGQRICTYYR